MFRFYFCSLLKLLSLADISSSRFQQ